MFKNAIARVVASLLLTVLAVGEAGADGVAILPKTNPDFERWQRIKKGREKRETQTLGGKVKNTLMRAPSKGEDELSPKNVTGWEPSAIDRSYLREQCWVTPQTIQFSMGATSQLPKKYDLREDRSVSPIGRVSLTVKNQNPYGTCWAHATDAALESWCLTRGDGELDFSEKHQVNMHGWDNPPDRGGNMDIAAAYLTRWCGPVAEEDDPYPPYSDFVDWALSSYENYLRAINGEKPPFPKSSDCNPIGHVQQISWLAPLSISDEEQKIKNELVSVKRAIQQYGALYASYYSVDDFYGSFEGYKEATYYFNADWTLYAKYEIGGGHAVTIVGWDDNFSKTNFVNEAPADGAFIVKNSWGEDWGVGGYFYVSYYDHVFARQELGLFANLEKVDNYGSIYQYDPYGQVNSYAFPAGDGLYYVSAWGANVFVAKGDEKIAAIGFYANVPATAYKIEIYSDCKANDPRSGTLLMSQAQEGTTGEYAGYYTIPLNEAVMVERGKRFSVVMKITTPKYAGPLAYEAQGYRDGYGNYVTRVSKASANAGESFCSYDGSTWYDFTVLVDPSANFCLKAYTKSETAKRTLTGINLSGDTSVASGRTMQIQCTAEYSDGFSRTVCPSRWELDSVGKTCVKSISADGLVTAGNVYESQRVVVTAYYSETGTKEFSFSWTFDVTAGKPDVPGGLKATQGSKENGIGLEWGAVRGAAKYGIYRSSTSSTQNATYLTDWELTSWNDESVEPGKDYTYFIVAKNSLNESSAKSDPATGWRKLSAPNVMVTKGLRLDGALISWGEVAGAAYYRVYRADDPEESAEKKAISGWITQTEYLDDTAEPGVTYYYYVIAAVDNRGSRPSDYSIIEDGYRGVPVVPQSLEISGESSIPSGGSATYTCDLIYSNNTRDKNVSASWSIESGPATVQGNKVTANVVSSNGKAVLKATYGGLSLPKTIQITAVKPHAPTSAPVVSVEENGIRVSWEAVADATSYSVFRKTGSVEVFIGTAIGKTDYLDDKAQPGVTYIYRISAGNNAGNGDDYSPYSDPVSLSLAAPSGVTATTDDPSKVTVSWKEVTGAKSYRVYRAESVSGTKTALGAGWQSKRSYEDATGIAGKTYYYFVQAAASATGSGAGAYSAGAIGKRTQPVILQSIEICDGATRVASGGRTVFTCKAHYSDGTDTPVVPEWSVSPSGSATIDANGQFVASKVTSDQTVAVGASYGGKTASPVSVRIVAPVAATAKIVNVRTSARWPFSGLIDIDYELQTTPSGTKAFVSVSGYDNDRQMAMAARTISGDGATGTAIAAGAHRLSWDVAADYPKFRSSSLGVDLAAVPVNIFPPTGVSATPDTSAGKITLTWPSAENATGYEVWRGTSSSIADAEKIGTVSAASFPDSTVVAGTTYYYWVRSIGEGGGASEFGDPVTARVNPTTYTIVFNANGGTGSMSSLPMVYGTANNLPANAFKPPHEIRVFGGWALSPSGEVVYGNGVPVNNLTTVNGGVVTLYAVWDVRSEDLMPLKNLLSFLRMFSGGEITDEAITAALKNPTITDMDGDTSCVSDLERAVLLEVGTMRTVCEYISKSQYDLISDDDLLVCYDMSRVIKYMKNELDDGRFDLGYTIVFKRNYGDEVEGYTQTKGVAFGNLHPKLRPNEYWRTNCEFLGWATSSTGTVAYEDGADLTKIPKPSGGTLTLYAIWKVVRVTVSFNANGGSGTMTNESVKTGSSYVIPTSKFKRTDYAFQGWATSSSGGVVYADGATIPSLSADLALYAKWKFSFVLSGSVNGSSVSLSWNSIPSTTKYVVYRCKYNQLSQSLGQSQLVYERIGETTNITFNDTISKQFPDKVIYYVEAVRSVGGTLKSLTWVF